MFGTKYGEKARVTNYKVGDDYIVNINGIKKNLKIAGILDSIEFNRKNTDLYGEQIPSINILQIVNETTMQELSKVTNERTIQMVYVLTDKAYQIEKAKSKIGDIIGKQSEISADNYEMRDTSESVYNQIRKMIIYVFVGFIALIAVVNIYNTITSSIFLRKKDVASLKSIGMSNKQVGKLMILESLFYGIDSIVYGVLISLGVLLIMYLKMVEIKVYKFIIPWTDIFICIVCTYITIFLAMWNAKRKIGKGNIIDEMKNENI